MLLVFRLKREKPTQNSKTQKPKVMILKKIQILFQTNLLFLNVNVLLNFAPIPW